SMPVHCSSSVSLIPSSFIYLHEPATTALYPLSLHDALPIYLDLEAAAAGGDEHARMLERCAVDDDGHGMTLPEGGDSPDGIAGAALGLGHAGQLRLLRPPRRGKPLEIELTGDRHERGHGCAVDLDHQGLEHLVGADAELVGGLRAVAAGGRIVIEAAQAVVDACQVEHSNGRGRRCCRFGCNCHK